MVRNGDAVEGMSPLRTGLAAYRASGAALFLPHYDCLLALACEITGQIDESLTLLGDALHVVKNTGERV